MSLTSKTSLLKGIFPPIATPFTKNTSKIDYQNLKANLQKLAKTNIKGVLAQGSNGEFPTFTEKERVKMVAKTREYLPRSKVLLAGSGCEGTSTTVEMTNSMANVGADAAMVITPSYYKGAMDDAKLIKHFQIVADKSKIPIVLYNVPKFTNVHLSAKAILELAGHENIIGMKESDGSCIEEKTPLITEALAESGLDKSFVLMAGSAGFIYKHYNLGATGSVCALANVLPELVCELHETLDADLQEKLMVPNDYVTAKYGVPGLKHVMDYLGFYGGPVRGPLVELSEAGKRDVEAVFEEFKN